MTRIEFWLTMDVVCVLYDCSQTSGRRTPMRNEMVGGVPNSWHKKGKAVDIVPDDMAYANVEHIVQQIGKLGLVALNEGDHIHVHATED